MNRIKETSLALTLVAASVCAAAPVQAGIISYDFTATVDTATVPLVQPTYTGSFGFDAARVPEAFSSDFGTRDADNDGLTIPLLGPIPEPSMTWLIVGAVLALAGLSSGTRGIHESV